MHPRLPPGKGWAPPSAPFAVKISLLTATILLATLPLAAGVTHSTWNSSVAGPRPALETDAFEANYNLSVVTLPNFNPLTAYLDNYRFQYPTIAFAGSCAGGILYIDNSSRLDCFDPYGSTVRNLTGPLTLLYQATPGLPAQIDNEFQLDSGSSVALLYGNLTTSPGDLTVETVDLSNGTVHQLTTPVQMDNTLQADYIGDGTVAIFNGTDVGGSPTYLADVYNGSCWPAGPSIGFAPNNIYWVPQLESFIDAAGLQLVQFGFNGRSLTELGHVWFNDSAIDRVDAVDGLVYNPANGRIALDLSTNLGNYLEVATAGSGTIAQKGSYGALIAYSLAAQRYTYSSTYVWATRAGGGGQTVLLDPFDNATLSAPGLVGRQESSGANGNFEFTDPETTGLYLSLNASLVNRTSLGQSQIIWATAVSSSGGGEELGPSVGLPSLFGIPDWYWFLGVLGIAAVATVPLARRLSA